MDNQNYVVDEKRGKAWNSPNEAAQWYQAELDRVEAERDELASDLRDCREYAYRTPSP